MPIINFSQPIYDADASAYFATAGITSTTVRQQISRFVTGVKDLGLWSSMVCWPLRSSQNAGAGLLAYSLGGLGVYPGTFAGATLPTWDANGVNFTNDSAAKITTSLTQGASDDINIFAVVECNAFVSEGNVICGTRSASNAGFTCSQDWYGQGVGPLLWDTTGANVLLIFLSRIINGSFNAYTQRISLSAATKTMGVRLNAGAESTASGVRTYNAGGNFTIGNQHSTDNSASLGGKMPFIAYFKTASISSSSLFTLYKTTLGTGLGLP